MSEIGDPCDDIYVEKEVIVTIKLFVHGDFSPTISEEEINKDLEEKVRDYFINSENDFTVESIELQ